MCVRAAKCRQICVWRILTLWRRMSATPGIESGAIVDTGNTHRTGDLERLGRTEQAPVAIDVDDADGSANERLRVGDLGRRAVDRRDLHLGDPRSTTRGTAGGPAEVGKIEGFDAGGESDVDAPDARRSSS